MGHDERCRDRNYPAKAGVEKECDKGLSSRPDNEIGRIVECVDRHRECGDADEAGRIMDRLVEEKYIDDLRYASAFARDKSSIAGWGATKIRYMLAAKGIDRETIAAVLQEVDEGKASDRLEKLLSAKVRSLKDDPQCRMKLLRFALGRGYQYDEAAEVIDRLLNERD